MRNVNGATGPVAQRSAVAPAGEWDAGALRQGEVTHNLARLTGSGCSGLSSYVPLDSGRRRLWMLRFSAPAPYDRLRVLRSQQLRSFGLWASQALDAAFLGTCTLRQAQGAQVPAATFPCTRGVAGSGCCVSRHLHPSTGSGRTARASFDKLRTHITSRRLRGSGCTGPGEGVRR
jgi:hypothetical protein